ncbi:MAG TPA: nuclear transport factor 2 family protein [Mycobacteriales bacterium]|jgi:ketosteroid isomerase-like protein|nr:nuclear transport factor 2 family protein [Mycobacteriales bacterium]
MATAQISNISRDGEVRPFKAHGQAAIACAGGAAYLVGTFEPGWRFTTDVAPIAGTQTCLTRHLGYVISGRMKVAMDDGTEIDLAPGDVFDLPPGHDAWVVGDEPCVMVDTSAESTRYATGGARAGVSEDRYFELVRRGYEAFNVGDIATLASLFSQDVVQHVPGQSALAGDYKGIEGVLGYYARLGEMTDGTFRADLIDVHGDGHGHVLALHQISATRNGMTRVSRGSILFSFIGNKITDLLELHSDLEGDDAFLS